MIKQITIIFKYIASEFHLCIQWCQFLLADTR